MPTMLANTPASTGPTKPASSPVAKTPPSQRFAKDITLQTTTTAKSSTKLSTPVPLSSTTINSATPTSTFAASPQKDSVGAGFSDHREASAILLHIVNWANSFKLGGAFDEPLTDPRQMSDGIALYLICEKAVPSAFTEAPALNMNCNTTVHSANKESSSPANGIGGANRFMKRSNLEVLFNGVSDFAISELKAEASFDLHSIADLTKIADLVPSTKDHSGSSISSVSSVSPAEEEGLMALATLCEYVLAVTVLSNSTEVISRMRTLPSSDQRPLSASVKKIMTLHNLQKSTERINTANTSCAVSVVNGMSDASPDTGFHFGGSFAKNPSAGVSVIGAPRRDSSVGAGSCAFESGNTNNAITGTRNDMSHTTLLAGTTMTQSEIDLTANLLQEIRMLKIELRDMSEDLAQAKNKLAVSQDLCTNLRAQLGDGPTRTDLSEKEIELMKSLKEKENQLKIATSDAASTSEKLSEAKQSIGSLEAKKREIESELESQRNKLSLLSTERAQLLDRIYELEFEQKANILREQHLKTRLLDVEAENDLFRIKHGTHTNTKSPSNLSADFVDEETLKASVIDSDEVADLKRKLQSAQLELNICKQKIAFGSIVDFGMTSMRHGRTESVISNAPGSTDLLSSTTRKARPIGVGHLTELQFAEESMNLEGPASTVMTRFKIKPSAGFDPRSDDLGGRAVIHVSHDGVISLECPNGALRHELIDLLETHEELVVAEEKRKVEPPLPILAPRVATQTKTEGKGCCAIM